MSVLNLLKIALFFVGFWIRILSVESWRQSYEYFNVAVINYPGKLFVPNFKLVGRERLVNGTAEFLKDLDNEYQISVELSSDATGAGYKQLPLEIPPMPFCTALRSFYQRFVKKSIVTGINTDVDFKNGKLCPFPKGMHFLKNVNFDTSEWAVILPRGLLKMRLNIWDKDEFAGGFEYILEIKDKAI